MAKALVAYFSATGTTKKLAERLAGAIGADIYEIEPAQKYTDADLDWTNKKSRSSVEMGDKSCRPALKGGDAPVKDCDVIYLAYPVWWYREPSIIDSFLEAYDFSGKKIVPLCTSGSSQIGTEAPKRMAGIAGGADVKAGKRFPADASADELKDWALKQ